MEIGAKKKKRATISISDSLICGIRGGRQTYRNREWNNGCQGLRGGVQGDVGWSIQTLLMSNFRGSNVWQSKNS